MAVAHLFCCFRLQQFKLIGKVHRRLVSLDSKRLLLILEPTGLPHPMPWNG